jgi:hypothetical protein
LRKAPLPVRPYREDDRDFIFRFFCGADPIPIEQVIPKSNPRYVCIGCGARISVEHDFDGAYLIFSSGSHSAAEDSAS